jgi:hypothetical protein
VQHVSEKGLARAGKWKNELITLSDQKKRGNEAGKRKRKGIASSISCSLGEQRSRASSELYDMLWMNRVGDSARLNKAQVAAWTVCKSVWRISRN